MFVLDKQGVCRRWVGVVICQTGFCPGKAGFCPCLAGFSVLGRLSLLDGHSHCQVLVCAAKQVFIVDKQVLVDAEWLLSFVRQVFVLSRQVFVRARRVFQCRPRC